MKVIFSRKGFDTSNGRIPNPILPDGTMLSFPIPSKDDVIRYDDLVHNNHTYRNIILQLAPNYKFQSETCHLDPDLRSDITGRLSEWQPAFGQMASALGHLHKQNVGVGDIFLFFGRFRKTYIHNGKLQFDRNSPMVHAIYGYMQIEKELYVAADNLPKWLLKHPHASYSNPHNSIYLGTEKLSFSNDLPGATTLPFSEKRVLTKMNPYCGVSKWQLPNFMIGMPISQRPNGWKNPEYFNSGGIGQEFVWETNKETIKWLINILH